MSPSGSEFVDVRGLDPSSAITQVTIAEVIGQDKDYIGFTATFPSEARKWKPAQKP
jgi:hypothetical protein